MEKSLVEKKHSNPYSIHLTDPIHISFGQNSDGFEILVCNLFYRPSTKRENGLP